MSERTYLGDGCYASFDGHGVELTTENGVEVTNRIYLEPQVYGALVQYRDRVTGKTTMNMSLAPGANAGCAGGIPQLEVWTGETKFNPGALTAGCAAVPAAGSFETLTLPPNPR